MPGLLWARWKWLTIIMCSMLYKAELNMSMCCVWMCSRVVISCAVGASFCMGYGRQGKQRDQK